MFDKEIKFICDFCLNKISKTGALLTFEKLKGIEIHPAIIKYISVEIDYQLYKDRQALLKESMFDYSGAEISKYFKMIACEIKKSKTINENEINDLISKAVTFNFDFITKPNETITNLIFHDLESRESEDLLKLLDYPYYYSYLSQILTSYIEKKQLLTVEKKEFEYLLGKINSELFSVKADDLLDNALEAMVDFFNIGAVLRSQVLPQAVELFLKEKNLNEYLSRLQHALTQSPRAKYEIDEIKKIINTPVPVVEQEEVESEQEETAVEEEKKEESLPAEISEDLNSAIKTVVQEELTPKPPSSTEVEEKKTEDLEIVPPPKAEVTDLTEEAVVKPKVEIIPVDKEEVKKPIESNFTRELKTDEKKRNDILSFLSDREIEKIISSIFNEDKEDFTITVETLNGCKTYEKATEILKSLYTTYNVNPYSRDAMHLTNAVAKYFNVQ